MCDFICVENIKSLIDHIYLQHLSAKKSAPSDDDKKPSLEDVANPHVTTFRQLRKAYEKNHNLEPQRGKGPPVLDSVINTNGSDDGLLMNGKERPTLNKIAIEDQVSTLLVFIYDSYNIISRFSFMVMMFL